MAGYRISWYIRSKIYVVAVIWSSAALKKNFLNEGHYADLVLFLLPLLLYGYSITFDYVLDDKLVVSENAFVKKGLAGIRDIVTRDSFAGLLGERTDLVAGGRYRPLSIITLAIEYQLFGLCPALSHFINVLLYAVTGLLLFRVLSFCGNEKQDRPFDSAQGGQWFLRLPFVASLLFVLHPIHSEVVANIKGRDEILALLFSLMALYFSIKAITSVKYRYWLISGLAFLLALLAKENAVTFLAVVPLYLYFFSKSSLRQTSVATLTLFAAVLVYTAIRYKALGYLFDGAKQITDLMNNPFAEATISQKYATILYTLGLYVKLLFFPHPLTHDYYPYHIPLIGWGDVRTWAPLLLYVAMLGYAVITFKKRNVTAFCIFYFLITLSVVSNLIFPVGTFMSERFMFMPSVGFCLIVAFWLTNKVPQSFKQNPKLSRWFSIFLLIFVCTGYSIKTVTRIPAWKDTMSLNRAGVKVSPDSARANCFMGYALYREARAGSTSSPQEGKVDSAMQLELYREAEFYIDRALSIYPDYATALNIKAGLLGGYFEHDGDLDKLLDGFYEIMKVRHVPYAIQYLGHLNKRQEYSSKLADFYHRVGFVLVAEQQKDYPLAEQYLKYGLAVAPNDIQIILDLTKVYYMWGDFRKALEMAQRGLALNGSHPELRRYAELANKGLSEQER